MKINTSKILKVITFLLVNMILLTSCKGNISNQTNLETTTAESTTTSNQIINTNETKYDFDFDGVNEKVYFEYALVYELVIMKKADNEYVEIGRIPYNSKEEYSQLKDLTLYYDKHNSEYFYVSEYDLWDKEYNEAEVNKYVFKDNTIEITNIAHCEFETLGYLPDNNINIVSNTLLGKPTTPISKQSLDELKHYYDGVDEYLSQFEKIKTISFDFIEQ